MNAALGDVASGIERRIAEIDEQLAATDRLHQEREHLTRALAEVTAAAESDTGSSAPSPASGGDKPPRRRRGRSSQAKSSRRTGRAPEGANRDRIVEHLRANGATSASATAKATGINRAVVYRNLSALVDAGLVAKLDGDGGTASFELNQSA